MSEKVVDFHVRRCNESGSWLCSEDHSSLAPPIIVRMKVTLSDEDQEKSDALKPKTYSVELKTFEQSDTSSNPTNTYRIENVALTDIKYMLLKTFLNSVFHAIVDNEVSEELVRFRQKCQSGYFFLEDGSFAGLLSEQAANYQSSVYGEDFWYQPANGKTINTSLLAVQRNKQNSLGQPHCFLVPGVSNLSVYSTVAADCYLNVSWLDSTLGEIARGGSFEWSKVNWSPSQREVRVKSVGVVGGQQQYDPTQKNESKQSVIASTKFDPTRKPEQEEAVITAQGALSHLERVTAVASWSSLAVGAVFVLLSSLSVLSMPFGVGGLFLLAAGALLLVESIYRTGHLPGLFTITAPSLPTKCTQSSATASMA